MPSIEQHSQAHPDLPTARAPYLAPQVIDYGDASALTKVIIGGPGVIDGGIYIS